MEVRYRRSIRRAGMALALLVLNACAPVPPPALTGPAAPTDFPAAYYRQAEATGKAVLRVVPERSLIVVEVRRAGLLARLGHDHIVASHDVRGYVAPGEGRADLYVALADLVVDEPQLRAEANFSTQPGEAAIAGTRRNMLDKVLDAEHFPYAYIRITRADAEASPLDVAITLHGATRTLKIPARIEPLPNGIAVSGKLRLKQSDFGIAPMSVLNGTLQVADTLDLHFRIVAAKP